jgi:hypothetical protein
MTRKDDSGLSAEPDNDVLLGDSAITAFVNSLTTSPVSRSQIYHWIESGNLPAGRLGAKVVASKKRITKHFEGLTGGG